MIYSQLFLCLKKGIDDYSSLNNTSSTIAAASLIQSGQVLNNLPVSTPFKTLHVVVEFFSLAPLLQMGGDYSLIYYV